MGTDIGAYLRQQPARYHKAFLRLVCVHWPNNKCVPCSSSFASPSNLMTLPWRSAGCEKSRAHVRSFASAALHPGPAPRGVVVGWRLCSTGARGCYARWCAASRPQAFTSTRPLNSDDFRGAKLLRKRRVKISVTFNFNFFNFPTGAGAPQLCRRARTPRKRACATLGAF